MCITYSYDKDHLSSGRQITISLEPVAESTEATGASVPTVTSTGSATCPNRWRFSGKENQSCLSANIPLLDFGARMYNPAIARWTAADPMAEKYFGISPYAYCLNNPVNIIDPDGKVVWFIPLIKGVVGAAVDAGAQVTISMSSGKTFMESLKSVDLTSVGTSLITSAVLSPGASKGVQAAVVGANLLDTGVDYSINDGIKTIGKGKNVEEVAIDFVLDVASSKASNGMQQAFKNDASAKLAPSVAAPLTKAERASLRSRKEFVNSEAFSTILDNTFSFTGGMTGNMIFEFVLPPKNIKDEKEEQ